jgi:hypothetical protein
VSIPKLPHIENPDTVYALSMTLQGALQEIDDLKMQILKLESDLHLARAQQTLYRSVIEK